MLWFFAHELPRSRGSMKKHQWLTCNSVCTAWVTGKTPSVADKHAENPMKYATFKHPRMTVMNANNVMLPGQEKRTCFSIHSVIPSKSCQLQSMWVNGAKTTQWETQHPQAKV